MGVDQTHPSRASRNRASIIYVLNPILGAIDSLDILRRGAAAGALYHYEALTFFYQWQDKTLLLRIQFEGFLANLALRIFN